VVGITLTDALENGRSYGPSGLGLTPFPGNINPLVTITSQPLPGPYQTWLAGYPSLTGLQAARTADPDGDGLPNLVELAPGPNPTVRNFPGSSGPRQANVPAFRRVGNRLYMDCNVISANLGAAPPPDHLRGCPAIQRPAHLGQCHPFDWWRRIQCLYHDHSR